MSRLIKMVNIIVDYRYGLLGASLLSTLALPQWSAALNARTANDGRIVVAQRQQEDPKQKGQSKGKQGTQPQHKNAPPPQRNVQPQKNVPQQRNAQPQHKEAPKQAPQQRSVEPQRKEAPKQRSVEPQRKEAPKQRSVEPQRKELPKQRSVEPQRKDLQKQEQRTGQPERKELPKQRSVEPQRKDLQKQEQKTGQPERKELPKQRSVEPQQKQLPRQDGRKDAQPNGSPRGPQNAQEQQRRGGNVEQLRSQRHERTEAGGRVVIEEPDHRIIVRENGRVFVRHNDTERFRRFGNAHEERRGGDIYTTVRRPDGTEIINVTDANGRLVRRIRRGRDRREIILIDNRDRGRPGFFLDLPAPRITIPRDRYIVDAEDAPPALLYETLEAPPVEPLDRAYSLDEVRYNVELRDRVRRVDIDTIHFETGSWEVASDQYPALQGIAEAILRVVSDNPQAVFMIEGYTDAVGEEVDNLSLSDRRAEAAAEILTSNFNVPPENLVTQGYGEQFLKVPTDGPNRENRRVSVRNITRLLKGQAAR